VKLNYESTRCATLMHTRVSKQVLARRAGLH
jgi:hypothetical protein